MKLPVHSNYKNKTAILLESDLISALFIPSVGGKLASLINKKTGYEFMVQRPGTIYRDQPFDGIYVEGECSGFDDMFPTIDMCYSENEPWINIKMADHGEVWSLPWDCEINTESIRMSVQGKRFPYRLEKKVCFISDNTLRFNYTLTNQSAFDFEFLWAGHLMLNMEVGTTVVVPDDCRRLVTILTNGSGKFGDVHEWPYLVGKDGQPYRADISRPKQTQGFEKYYFLNKLQEGWCELLYPDKKNKIKVSFANDAIPYLGILMNENGWDDLYNIIIEPCSICYDRPDLAKKYGQISKVEAMGSISWWMELTI
jgi:hypothetical protein